MYRIRQAAVIGGGVIGGGWLARLVLNGIDVNVFDPDPEAERKLDAVLRNAERAYARLTATPAPRRGRVRACTTVSEAVADADFIQESTPERLELKRSVLAQVATHAAPDALVGSSTSGLLPSDLQRQMAHPERMLVAHPYNPVYLLPLVELVGGQRTSAATLTRARQAYAGIGMVPVVIRKEIDAFVGDRLLESVWREALWLVRDDVASVEEIDDIIRYSFGLRWAQMGLFMTYRLAGGEAGMRHFIEQFGPTLEWPWTRLMDVPELDQALIDKIVSQSDAQADGLTVGDLERIRDDNLVAIMQALQRHDGGRGWGAGHALTAFEQLRTELSEAAPVAAPQHGALGPVEIQVRKEWLDPGGALVSDRQLALFEDATATLLTQAGVTGDYLLRSGHYRRQALHLDHHAALRAGDSVQATLQVLAAADDTLRVRHSLRRYADATLLASTQGLLVHIGAASGTPCAAGATVLERLRALT